MNILIATNSAYVSMTLMMLSSLFFHHKEVSMDIYLPYEDLTEDELLKIKKHIEKEDNKKFFPMRVGEDFKNKVESHNGISVDTYYRILAIELLPKTVDKILYLDVDMIIKGSLLPLYETDIENLPFGACEDILGILNNFHEANKYRMNIPKEYTYFNAGVLLMNIKYLRENGEMDKILNRVYKNQDRYEYNDQDVLNEMYFDKIKALPWDLYNLPPAIYMLDMEGLKEGRVSFADYEAIKIAGKDPDTFKVKYQDFTEKMYENASVIHYMGNTKPWREDRLESFVYEIFDKAYFEYFISPQ